MNLTTAVKTVIICDTQPVTIGGVRALLVEQPDLDLIGEAGSLLAGMELVRKRVPELLIVDKAFGLRAVVDWISHLSGHGRATSTVVWGSPLTQFEALRALEAGALGVLAKSTSPNLLLNCLRTVATGETWMENVIRAPDTPGPMNRPGLTQREVQVAELVEQGLRNKEIARALGISPGTVKIHLKHIFEKTGVRGRYGLALVGLREKAAASL